MTDSAITTRDLRKSFRKTEVLKGVSFDVLRGEIFALLGSNGAGKTTTIKVLATLVRPDSGTSSISGFDVAKSPDKVRQSISLTGQFTAVDEILTGRENLHMIARLRELKKLLPPAKVEYIEKQPTLEDIFLHMTREKK